MDRGDKFRHSLGGNEALKREVSDKLLRRRQRYVDVPRLIEQEHRVVKDWI